jgi:hypothetical protein
MTWLKLYKHWSKSRGLVALLDDPPTARVTYEQKNALNNMSVDYAKAQRRRDT